MRRYVSAAAVLLGLALAGVALFANQIGFDRNPGWGRNRILLLCCGLLVVALVALATGWPVRLARLKDAAIAQSLWSHRVGILSAMMVLFALAVYIFFLSGGKWKGWADTTRYYDNLGTAFRSGRLDLNIRPSAELAALTDPYEPSVRNASTGAHDFVEKVWDLTFYKGKFYVYWGPGPAALLALIKLFYDGAIGDQYLVFVFLAGLLVCSTVLILRLRRDLYEDTPLALTILAILVAAFFCPIPWMLNRAAIYEATIAGGQFFLMGGLWFAYVGVARVPASRGMLFAAGVLWALAAASRTLILIPAGFLTLMIILWQWTDGGRVKPALSSLARHLPLALPLLVGTLAVAWYNWARFGSVFETGLRYTLTFENLDRNYGEAFSPYYALPSLWAFLFNGLQVQARFPFLAATFGRSPAFLVLKPLGLYHTEDITGLIFSVPFVFFSIIAVVNAARLGWQQYARGGGLADRSRSVELWMSLCLAGSGLLTFAAVILYFNVTMRFFAEFLPSLIVLAVLGIWQGYRSLANHVAWRRSYVGFVMVIGLASILVSLLLAFSESHGTVQHYNPQLMRQLIRLFGG